MHSFSLIYITRCASFVDILLIDHEYILELSADGTTLEMLAQCDASPSARRCDTVLCSGFMAILSTPDTRRLFDPALVFNDGQLQARLGQRFVCLRLKGFVYCQKRDLETLK